MYIQVLYDFSGACDVHTHTVTRAHAHTHTHAVVILTRLSSYQSISLLRFTVVIIRTLSSSTLVGYPTTKDKVRVRPTTGRTEVEGCSCIYHPPCHHHKPPLYPPSMQWCTTMSNVLSSVCHGRKMKQIADMLISLVFVSKHTLIHSLRWLLWLVTIYQEIRRKTMISYRSMNTVAA